MNYHLIIGHGYWSKKNLNYLKKKKIFDEIIIKTRKKYFFYSSGSDIKKDQINKIFRNIQSVHICTPLKNHFKNLKEFNYFKKTAIEKPFLRNTNELVIIQKNYKKKYLIVNYIDTFNPLVSKIQKTLKKEKFNQIILNYSKKNRYYKNKNDFAIDWLDHPLSLILLFFKDFPKFDIELNRLRKKNAKFNKKIIINYNFKNFNLKIKLNCSNFIERNLQVFSNNYVKTFYFYKNSLFKNRKKIYQSKKNSFDVFYDFLVNKKKSKIQNFKFHKKIILERNKILRKLEKN